jgi:hypothetical protein
MRKVRKKRITHTNRKEGRALPKGIAIKNFKISDKEKRPTLSKPTRLPNKHALTKRAINLIRPKFRLLVLN